MRYTSGLTLHEGLGGSRTQALSLEILERLPVLGEKILSVEYSIVSTRGATKGEEGSKPLSVSVPQSGEVVVDVIHALAE
jgi:hypothetical protein